MNNNFHNVSLEDSVYKQLLEIKEKTGLSFNKIIEKLINSSEIAISVSSKKNDLKTPLDK